MMESKRWMEAWRISVFKGLELLEKTNSKASTKAGRRMTIPSKSKRNKSQELIKMLAITSLHSRLYKKKKKMQPRFKDGFWGGLTSGIRRPCCKET